MFEWVAAAVHGQWWKLVINELTTSAQPSTMTNNKSLNGNDTRTGGSMNMPIDIRVELTTRSMIRNGMKITNPMMNAVFSSERMNAGISVDSGTLSRDAGACRPRH